jgi:single-stranded-DNA-specific exonuclease
MDLLDLVALATVCDVMPLTGVNRALVTQGLKVMAKRGHAGIAALLDVGLVRDVPSAHSLGFVLGPRINAAGRIDEPDLGLRLLDQGCQSLGPVVPQHDAAAVRIAEIDRDRPAVPAIIQHFQRDPAVAPHLHPFGFPHNPATAPG